MGYIKFSVIRLDGNYHGPGHSTLRRTWQIVRMGSYAKTWTLYIYRGGRADDRADGVLPALAWRVAGRPAMISELRSYTGCLALLAFVVVAFGGVAKACIFAFDWLFG